MRYLALIAAIVFALATTPALAERRVALVVGNAAYETVPALPNPDNDATAIAAKLEEVGFEVLLRTDLDQSQMAAALGEFAAALENADVALLFYAGHGIQFDGRNYLISTNAELSSQFALSAEAFALDQIVDAMRESSAINIVLLDACRDNPFVDRLKEAMPASRSATVSRGLARVSGPAGDTMIVYATAADQTAADGAGAHSPFTQALLDNIGTPGVEISLVLKRVIQDVRERTLYTQNPEVLSAMAREFYFAGSETPAAIPAIAPLATPTTTAAPLQVIDEAAVAAPNPRTSPAQGANETGTFDTSVLAALDVGAALEAAQEQAAAMPTPEAIEDALGLAKEDVLRIQTALTALGYNLGVVDGALGQKSREALKEFQLGNQIPQTGYLDIETIEGLLWLFDEAPKTYEGKWRIDIYRRWLVTDRNSPSNAVGTRELLASVYLASADGTDLLIDHYEIYTQTPDEPFKDFSATIDTNGTLRVSGTVSTHFGTPGKSKRLVFEAPLPRILPLNGVIDKPANDFEEDLAFDVAVTRAWS